MDAAKVGMNMMNNTGMTVARKSVKPAEVAPAGIDMTDKLSTGAEQKDTVKVLQDKIKTMKKEARKGYLLGCAGVLCLGMAAVVTGLPALGLAAGGAVALFKGSQIIHDKVLNA